MLLLWLCLFLIYWTSKGVDPNTLFVRMNWRGGKSDVHDDVSIHYREDDGPIERTVTKRTEGLFSRSDSKTLR